MILHDIGLYFRDTHDHLSQIVCITESQRDTLLAAMQMHLSLVAVQQNEMSSGWQAGAIVFVPTIVCSIYGMNFQNMPEQQWQYGYPFKPGQYIRSTGAEINGSYFRTPFLEHLNWQERKNKGLYD